MRAWSWAGVVEESSSSLTKAEPITAAAPVVVLSADATQGVVRRLLAIGALAYLTKPLDLAELGGFRLHRPVEPPPPEPARTAGRGQA